MAEGQSFPERLRALRQRGGERVAPLWLEQLPREEALSELRGRTGPVFRLQEARLYLELGRHRDALFLLRDLEGLPQGLASLRAELQARGEADALRSLTDDGPTSRVRGGAAVAEDPLNASRVSRFPGPHEAVLAEWLDQVQRWRRALGV